MLRMHRCQAHDRCHWQACVAGRAAQSPNTHTAACHTYSAAKPIIKLPCEVLSCPAGPSASNAFLPRAVPSTRWELTNTSAKVRLVSSCCRVDTGRDAISAATACNDATPYSRLSRVQQLPGVGRGMLQQLCRPNSSARLAAPCCYTARAAACCLCYRDCTALNKSTRQHYLFVWCKECEGVAVAVHESTQCCALHQEVEGL